MIAHLSGSELLRALPGICYVVTPEGNILAIGNHVAWQDFAVGNNAPELARAGSIVGRNLFDGIAGEAQALYRELFASLAAQPRAAQLHYRCDAPDIRREHLLLLAVLSGPVILCQNVTLESKPRPYIGLFDAPVQNAEPLVAVCSYCKDVRQDQTWRTPEEYYAAGGRSDVHVTHGVCPRCLQKMMALIKQSSA